MKILLENNIFVYSSICHIDKQIDIWIIKFKKTFEDALKCWNIDYIIINDGGVKLQYQ